MFSFFISAQSMIILSGSETRYVRIKTAQNTAFAAQGQGKIYGCSCLGPQWNKRIISRGEQEAGDCCQESAVSS